ncbi:MAG: NADH-quinone oxidoreductase subunit L [Deltaproteobacteria bacterium]|nr:NADH-quinone oxidoreductase subunit L [Deltaproteobacteria bacterium]MBW1951644.1 NADH-quinone oxidoreductase subunit L [Deltaproteobacteria bacterium]MBW1985744.1 NADH-quinone oxidoreductase subunit L [Deltaproteobacteria bacterium]MBW2134657.1 NADH-quinone oxidoreductase subunit L [Deltaproteobacteria bacterium]
MIQYVWLVPLVPILGFLFNGLLGRRVPKWLVSLVGCSVIGISFLIVILIFREYVNLPADAKPVEVVVYDWISSGNFNALAAFLVDPLSLVMMLVVSGVSFIIHIYSVGYMHDDEGYPRYFAFLNLFVFAMLILVSANNFLLMFVGWEGVGLCSYLLIGYWYEKQSASDAGKKAFVVNRIGDFGFLLGIFLIFWTFNTINFREVFSLASSHYEVGSLVITAITLLLFVGATGKSAQLPLYVWLPDAMEGPTPVSALIHAATMVTAGVYMVARCSALYVLAPVSLTVVALVGAITAIYSASIGMAQNDIKRVLAYSTVSQLGYMFLACGVGAFAAGIFHLMTHAFFKALLFLGSGSVIHALSGEQDMRKMGDLKKHLPITYWTFIIATLAIAGIFPFAGFFSKDEILYKSLVDGHILYWLIAASAAFMTAFYMFRLIFLTFHGESRVDPEVLHHVHESPPVMTLPLMALAVLSTIGGFVGIPIIEGANVFHEFLVPAIAHVHRPEIHYPISFEVTMMVVSVVIALLGINTAYRMYIKRPELPQVVTEKVPLLYDLIYHKYYVDELYDATVVNPIKVGSDFLWKGVDDQVVDGAVNGSAGVIEWLSYHIRKLETGYVQNYALAILIGVFIIAGYYLGR